MRISITPRHREIALPGKEANQIVGNLARDRAHRRRWRTNDRYVDPISLETAPKHIVSFAGIVHGPRIEVLGRLKAGMTSQHLA